MEVEPEPEGTQPEPEPEPGRERGAETPNAPETPTQSSIDQLRAEEAAIVAQLAALPNEPHGLSRWSPVPDDGAAAQAARDSRTQRAATLAAAVPAAEPIPGVAELRAQLIEALGTEAVAATAKTSLSLEDDACLGR